jgi:hypothetical protein
MEFFRVDKILGIRYPPYTVRLLLLYKTIFSLNDHFFISFPIDKLNYYLSSPYCTQRTTDQQSKKLSQANMTTFPFLPARPSGEPKAQRFSRYTSLLVIAVGLLVALKGHIGLLNLLNIF